MEEVEVHELSDKPTEFWKSWNNTVNIMRLQVRHPSSPPPENKKIIEKTLLSSTGEEHPGIVCCCCHQQVRGFRYKCMICPSYDICGVCEGKSIHPLHDMVRITTPRQYPPHFFTRLHRLYERSINSSPSLAKHSNSYHSGQVSRDLLDDDSSDASDLELEISNDTVTGDNILTRKRNNSDPGKSVRQAPPIGHEDKKNFSLLQEKLPSFEELARSMQDLAEKDMNEFCVVDDEDISIMKSKGKSSGHLTTFGGGTNQEQNKIRKGCLSNDKNKKIFQSSFDSLILTGNVDDRQETCKNKYKENIIDSAVTFKNIQQDIENLLAPLTPMPDYDLVPEVDKTEEKNENIAGMNNITGNKKHLVEEHIRYESLLDILEHNRNNTNKIKQNDSWDFQSSDKFGKMVYNLKEEIERSETEAYEDKNNGNHCNVEHDEANYKRTKQLFEPHKNCTKTAQTLVSENDLKTAIDDTMKYFENAVEKSPEYTNMNGLSEEVIFPAKRVLERPKESQKSSFCFPMQGEENGERREQHNPRVGEALTRMVGMGFTDEDGWLTQLLIMKQGDISQVLDMLAPVKL